MLKGSLNLVASLLGPDHWDGLSAIDPALQPAAEHHVRAHVPESGPQHLAARNLCQEHKNIELWLYGIIYFVVMYFVYLNIITELNWTLNQEWHNYYWNRRVFCWSYFYLISEYSITNVLFIKSDLQLFIKIVTGTEPDKQEMIWFFLSDLHWMNRNQIDGFL